MCVRAVVASLLMLDGIDSSHNQFSIMALISAMLILFEVKDILFVRSMSAAR